MNHQTAEIQESRVSVLEADPTADLLAKPIDSVTAKADKAAETIEALTIKISELTEKADRAALLEASLKDAWSDVEEMRAEVQALCGELNGQRVISVCAECGSRHCTYPHRKLIVDPQS